MVVEWEDGRGDAADRGGADRRVEITEGVVSSGAAGAGRTFGARRAVAAVYVRSRAVLGVHRQTNLHDFTVQPLLSGYLSRTGPCMAKADINGDGLEDIFIGGGRGQP